MGILNMELIASLCMVIYMVANFFFRNKAGQVTTLGIFLVDMVLEGIKEEQEKAAAAKLKEKEKASPVTEL